MSKQDLYSEAQDMNEVGLLHPFKLAVDSTIASTWQGVALPLTVAARVTGISPPPQLPKADMTGKVAIVTGSNTGIGYRTALHLAETGLHLIMAVRSMERGTKARTDLLRELSKRGVKDPKIEVVEMDLLDPASIRKFADNFKAQHKQLHVLVNNAGTNIPGVREDTGLDYVFTVSYLGHYMLTDLLYDTIKRTEGARIVNLSSLLHRYGSTRWEEAAKGGRGSDNYFNALFNVYCDSKLAMMLFTQSLRVRLAEDGASAQAFAVSPGNVKSDIWRAVPLWLRIPFDLFARVAFLSTDQGCHTSVVAALAPLKDLELQGYGKPALYVQPYGGPIQKRPYDVIGPFSGAIPTKASLPPNVQAECERLSSVSAELCAEAERKQKAHTAAGKKPAFSNR